MRDLLKEALAKEIAALERDTELLLTTSTPSVVLERLIDAIIQQLRVDTPHATYVIPDERVDAIFSDLVKEYRRIYIHDLHGQIRIAVSSETLNAIRELLTPRDA